jgi:hypothetical protein
MTGALHGDLHRVLRASAGEFANMTFTRAVRKVSVHFEYLENRLRGLDVTWQPVRGDLTVHP